MSDPKNMVVSHGASRQLSDAELADLAQRCLTVVDEKFPERDKAVRADERACIREEAGLRALASRAVTLYFDEDGYTSEITAKAMNALATALLASAVELPEPQKRWRVVCRSCGASEEGSGDEVPLRLHGRMENGNWQHYVANAFTAHEWCGPVVSADALPAEHGRLWNIIKAWDIERPRQNIDNLCERIDAARPAEDGLREAKHKLKTAIGAECARWAARQAMGVPQPTLVESLYPIIDGFDAALARGKP
jgi:hypothetical protein